MRSPPPLYFQYGDFTKGKSLLTEEADYFIYEKPPSCIFNMVTSLKERVYSQREQIHSFMRSPPWTFNMVTSLKERVYSQRGQIISL